MINQTERIAAALAQLVTAIEELRSLGVIRSRRLSSDFAEWLVTQLYEGELAEMKNQKGWDVRSGDELIQVKMAFFPDNSINRWSFVSAKHPFDSLVLVVLSDEFKVRELYKIRQSEVLPLLRPDSQGSRVNWSELQPWRITRSAIPAYDRIAAFFDLPE